MAKARASFLEIKEVGTVELKIGAHTYELREPSADDQYAMLDKLKENLTDSEKSKIMIEFIEELGLSAEARKLIPARSLPEVINFLLADK